MMKKAISVMLCMLTILLYTPVVRADSALTVTYDMPTGRSEDVLLDTDAMTRVTVKHGTEIAVKLSNAAEGRTAYIEWFTVPKDAVLQQYDAANKLIASIAFAEPDGYFSTVALDAGCTKVTLGAENARSRRSSFRTAGSMMHMSGDRVRMRATCCLSRRLLRT